MHAERNKPETASEQVKSAGTEMEANPCYVLGTFLSPGQNTVLRILQEVLGDSSYMVRRTFSTGVIILNPYFTLIEEEGEEESPRFAPIKGHLAKQAH